MKLRWTFSNFSGNSDMLNGLVKKHSKISILQCQSFWGSYSKTAGLYHADNKIKLDMNLDWIELTLGK